MQADGEWSFSNRIKRAVSPVHSPAEKKTVQDVARDRFCSQIGLQLVGPLQPENIGFSI